MFQNLDYNLATIDQLIQDLGERIARVRLSRNISQDELAQKTGLTRRTLSRLETGQGATLNTWVRVMRGLELMNHLEACLPDPGIQPVQRLASGKSEERKRARASKQPEQPTWRWNEDETP